MKYESQPGAESQNRTRLYKMATSCSANRCGPSLSRCNSERKDSGLLGIDLYRSPHHPGGTGGIPPCPSIHTHTRGYREQKCGRHQKWYPHTSARPGFLLPARAQPFMIFFLPRCTPCFSWMWKMRVIFSFYVYRLFGTVLHRHHSSNPILSHVSRWTY